MAISPFSASFFTLLVIQLNISFPNFTQARSSLCRTYCGNIPINYPLSIDDGCGSPYYRNLLICSSAQLFLRTPSGQYPVRSASYSDPHLLISDPLMWNCLDGRNFRRTRPFSLDTGKPFSLSPQNDYLFFNCSPDHVIIAPKPIFCERFPERCDSSCDSASYLCRQLPECAHALEGRPGGGGAAASCCSYHPKATESLRLMLKYCAAYTSVYWRNIGANPPYDQVPEYGIRLDFDIPVTTRCLQCQDTTEGGGSCGFETESLNFLCLCKEGNVTTYCKDPNIARDRTIRVVAGTATVVSAATVAGVGAGIWYLKKLREKAPVTHGVQSNENRLF